MKTWSIQKLLTAHNPTTYRQESQMPDYQEWVLLGRTDPVFHYWQCTLLIQCFPLAFGPLTSTVNIMRYLQPPEVAQAIQFPHLAIAVSQRLEVKSSGHAWLDGCNFQRKQLLVPTEYRQSHFVQRVQEQPIRNDTGNLHKRINSGAATILHFSLR